MKRIDGWVSVLVTIIFVVALSACGGGGSDSGGGGDASFVGTYRGPLTLIITPPGVAPISVPGVMTVVINPDGTVVVDPGTPTEFSGIISGNTFTASLPAPLLNEPGFNCTGTVNVTGTGAGNMFTGTFSGSVVCNGVPMTISGTFTVSKIAKAPLDDTTLGEEIREVVRQVGRQ